ncbi:antiviral innate immune response receptor RIG-I-like isoform X2 [Gigantopelta aegis]|uniref:antiviral innate immune response receptor RIG-I-like isoform X2 n=1 Tax=Gigantopelta aegis TaxID=1735272 RepID=UPI001B88994C|nr:antiviral innate immune response receptor RIG-I-like isoform X2 [Gigantopelta aegis]
MDSMMESASQEKVLIHNIDTVYRQFILQHVKFSHLVSYVDCIRAKASQINKLDRQGAYKEAGELFLELLKKSDDQGRWQQFRDALQEEEYEHVVTLLNGDIGTENHNYKVKIIELLQNSIAEKIDATELCYHLKGKNIISNTDEEEILQIKENHGNIVASLYLLNNIWKKKKNWFEEFLSVLIDLGLDHVAELLDPVYVQKYRAHHKPGQVESMEVDTRTMVAGSIQDHGEAYTSVKNFADDTSILDDDENILSQTMNKQVSMSSLDESIQKLNINLCDSETNEKQEKITGNKITDEMNVETELEGHCSDEENVDINDTDITDDDDPSAPNVNVPSKTLQLRPYQEELATLSLAGKNTIIVAPTGSGKTIVAVRIMQEHLKKRGVGVRKIIFLVNQVALAKQQFDSCKEYMNADWPLQLVSGDTQDTNKVPLKDLLDRNKILFLTAQILLDALRDKEIESLCTISMLIFDECHHTKARHPFNEIMHLYMDLKFGENADYIRLPQIVGLTASVGVGKASSLEGAVTHIKSLCANLDAETVVTVEKNAESLARFAKVTDVDVQRCNKRTEDKFYNFVTVRLMKPIEIKIQSCGTSDPQTTGSLQSKLTPPAQGGCDQYSQWISALKREVAKIDDQKLQRLFVSRRRYLEVYNDALILNEDCRTEDALHYMDSKFSEIYENQAGCTTDVDTELRDAYEKNKPYLQSISKEPGSKNPKIVCLESMLRSAFRKNPESRAMVFVKTRAQATALKSWMKETPGLKDLNPGVFTGAQASVDKGGMTKTQQVDVLKFFRQGQHKLIIATSVAEEGLDISACNLVIRYDHVTNEIAMVQARGRARAENSRFAVIASAQKGSAQKEELNLVREMLMKRAIQKLQQEVGENSERFGQNLVEIQKKSKVDREIEAAMYKGRTLKQEEFVLRCYGCNAFACISSDIKTIEKVHHAILSSDFDEQVNYKPHPKPVVYGSFKKQEKMYCKKCGQDWGISVIYKTAKFPIVKIESFILEDSMGARDIVKKWKNVPFATMEINQDDMEKKLSMLNDSQ